MIEMSISVAILYFTQEEQTMTNIILARHKTFREMLHLFEVLCVILNLTECLGDDGDLSSGAGQTPSLPQLGV